MSIGQQSLNYMDTARGLIENGRYTFTGDELDVLDGVREDYEDFRDENNLDASEAALHFMASAGLVAESNLDWRSDRDRFFRTVRDALGSERSRTGMILERITTGDFWYEGVSETDLRKAYENLDASPMVK
ncbi:MAG: hypothetical protein V5A72_03300 [Candidatus Nanohaloarchaea archaeon]